MKKLCLRSKVKAFLAENAELGVEASLTPVENITGSVMNYVAGGPVKGSLFLLVII